MTLTEIGQIHYQSDEGKNMAGVQNNRKNAKVAEEGTSLNHMNIKVGVKIKDNQTHEILLLKPILIKVVLASLWSWFIDMVYIVNVIVCRNDLGRQWKSYRLDNRQTSSS